MKLHPTTTQTTGNSRGHREIPFQRGQYRNCTALHVVWQFLLLAQCWGTYYSFANLPQSTFSTPTIRLPRGSVLSSKINGEDNPNNDHDSWDDKKKKKKEGQTGWNHNLPRKSSEFGDIPSENENENSSSSSSSSSSLRTGWLHNTQSPSERVSSSLKSDESTNPTKKKNPNTTGLARRRLELAMKQQDRHHRLLQPPSFHAVGTDTMIVTEHVISVPLERSSDQTRFLDVHFTLVEKEKQPPLSNNDAAFWNELSKLESATQRAQRYVEHANLDHANGLLLYLQGGPGLGAPTPVAHIGLHPTSSWIGAALQHDDIQRIVLMDPRGTGRSTPITKQTLERQFPKLDQTDSEMVQQVTDYFTHFRADNIVLDAEDIRDALLMPRLDSNQEPRPWGCSLGQSFGGYCTLTYLSQVQHPPKICLLTGGIPPLLSNVDEVYRSLWHRVKQRSHDYYKHYPGDVALVKRIVRQLMQSPVPLPSGGTLTARRFLQLGLALGGSPSNYAVLHRLFHSALLPDNNNNNECVFARSFLKEMELQQVFDDAPLYYWLHETIYANGSDPSTTPTNWSAHRQYEDLCASQNSEYDYRVTSHSSDDRPVLFFGEMVFPWMSDDYGELSGWHAVADALAQKQDWKPLYDSDAIHNALSRDGRRAAAAVYYDDMFVDLDACTKVLQGPLANCKPWITNEYQHSGLRDDGKVIFDKLYGMAQGHIRTPS